MHLAGLCLSISSLKVFKLKISMSSWSEVETIFSLLHLLQRGNGSTVDEKSTSRMILILYWQALHASDSLGPSWEFMHLGLILMIKFSRKLEPCHSQPPIYLHNVLAKSLSILQVTDTQKSHCKVMLQNSYKE